MSQLMIHTIIEPPSESFSLECSTTKPLLRSFQKPVLKMLSVFFCLGFVLFASLILDAQGIPSVIDARGQSISRGVHNGIAFAKFKAHKFSYLNMTSLGTDYVLNGKECGFACVNIPSCFSFNLAAFYDINGRILCELLPSDKYNNSEKFVSSQFFHHFSIGSPCMSGPCQNDGTCVSLYEKNSYVCLCTKGHTGSICQTEKPRFLIICEKKKGKITCQNGKKISILDANYGRLDRDTCLRDAMSNINCRSSNSLQIVRGKCNGKTECQLHAVNNELGGDPCGETYKYLEVKYRCLEL